MAEDATSGFTAGETTLLVTIMQNLNSTIDFDAEKVAAQLGYKNGNIVKTRWGQIKRKKIDGAGAGGSPGGGGVKKRAATPKKGGKGKGKKVVDGGSGSGDDEEGGRVDTPVKGKGKAKAKKVDGKEDGEGSDGEAGKESDGEGNAKVKTEAGDESDLQF